MAANPLTFYCRRKSKRLALLCFKYTDSQRNLLCLALTRHGQSETSQTAFKRIPT